MKWPHIALAGMGGLGFGLLVIHTGPAAIWDGAIRLGAVPAATIVAIALVEHLLHALGWRACFEPRRRPGTLYLLGAYLSGLAINFATPTATLGGEFVRGSLLPRGVSTADAVVSITTDRLAFALADSLLAVGGLVALIAHGPVTGWARVGVLAAAALLAFGLGTFFRLQRSGRLAGFLARHPLVRKLGGDLFADRIARGSSEVDERLAAFHADRRRWFAASVLLHVAGTAVGALQLLLFLIFLGVPHDPIPVIEAFLVALALDLFSFFIPARLGAYEGSRVIAMSVAGFAPALGLLFSLVLRVEQVVWAGIGLVLYPSMAARRATGAAAEAADERSLDAAGVPR
jgi:hypothetical protein